MIRLALFLVFLLVATNAYAAPGAHALEAKLLAPCCWGGTLDVHDSELARDLRREIEARIERGESSDAIQADFVSRFGPRIVAVPDEHALSMSVIFSAVCVGVGAIALWRVVSRWRQPSKRIAKSTKRDVWDDRLDAELAALDE